VHSRFGTLNIDVRPTTTFGQLKRTIAVNYALAHSWLTLDHAPGEPRFRDLSDDLTLHDSLLPDAQFDSYTGPKLEFASARGPLRISTSRFCEFTHMRLFPCDRAGEVKRRICSSDATPPEEQRLLWDGRELDDDFALENLPLPREERTFTAIRYVIRGRVPIHIWIQKVSGGRFGLDVLSSDLVGEVKDQVRREAGFDDPRLFVGGRELVDADVVGDCPAQNGFAFHLVCSGMAAETNEESPFQVNVQHVGEGKVVALVVQKSDKIWDAGKRFGYDWRCNDLWLGNLSLDPEKSFEDYAIQSGTILHFVVLWTVFVRGPANWFLEYRIRSAEFVGDLKRMICARQGILIDKQQLLFTDEKLADERTLREYGVAPKSTLQLEVVE
jgi:hypothetical protein